jgi:hypothetical protein
MPLGVPQSLPSEPLREALKRLGLPPALHRRSSLRTLIHLCTGEPPPIGTEVDEMAKAFLFIACDAMPTGQLH